MSEQTNNRCNARAAADIAHTPFEATQLDLAGCDRVEIVVTLYEHEKASQRPESWPGDVLQKIYRHAESWIDTHKDRALRGLTYGVAKYNALPCCVLILHHAAKDLAAKEAQP